MKNYTLFYIALLVITLFISGCAIEKSTGNPNAVLTIYTSVYPIQYAVERVGGDTVNTASVFPPGVDAHTYEPTSKEMANIAKGEVMLLSILGMGWKVLPIAWQMH
ncbi:metal ABC transporter solute-binding protein, Zn/Mn family [Ornithinibacillus contaminans]|uniref:metal ABC transporter solute-binding protein, Zn/Mn family n=1 Tax=Ornithinibacillus contaminans TaxID=694055 RepID=UPI000B18C341|nr:zinc ABC transporter substrate-binding protein [Ornithinibacillus contaminans]